MAADLETFQTFLLLLIIFQYKGMLRYGVIYEWNKMINVVLMEHQYMLLVSR